MLFGPRVFHTLDPQNVETILSSNFDSEGPLGLVNDIR